MCAIGVDAQRDLLRQRPARHEDRRRFAQQLGYLLLKIVDKLTLPVHIGQSGRIGVRGQIGQDGLRGVTGARMPDQPAGAVERQAGFLLGFIALSTFVIDRDARGGYTQNILQHVLVIGVGLILLQIV